MTTLTPNIMIKQEMPDDNYGICTPQVARSYIIMIMQEVVDESYNYNNIFSTQGSSAFINNIY